MTEVKELQVENKVWNLIFANNPPNHTLSVLPSVDTDASLRVLIYVSITTGKTFKGI